MRVKLYPLWGIVLACAGSAAALREYRAAMRSDPNRFNTLYGAGKAAEALGRHAVAVRYYRELLANCKGASGDALADLKRARQVVGKPCGKTQLQPT